MHAQRQPVTAGARCLVIEDNLFDQKLFGRVLSSERIDADLDFATTLEDARDILRWNRYSLILCDNNLPDGNGAAFALELAHSPRYRLTPIVIVSGWPSPFMWAKARAAGVQIVDKNDRPKARLAEIFRAKLS